MRMLLTAPGDSGDVNFTLTPPDLFAPGSACIEGATDVLFELLLETDEEVLFILALGNATAGGAVGDLRFEEAELDAFTFFKSLSVINMATSKRGEV